MIYAICENIKLTLDANFGVKKKSNKNKAFDAISKCHNVLFSKTVWMCIGFCVFSMNFDDEPWIVVFLPTVSVIFTKFRLKFEFISQNLDSFPP